MFLKIANEAVVILAMGGGGGGVISHFYGLDTFLWIGQCSCFCLILDMIIE